MVEKDGQQLVSSLADYQIRNWICHLICRNLARQSTSLRIHYTAGYLTRLKV